MGWFLAFLSFYMSFVCLFFVYFRQVNKSGSFLIQETPVAKFNNSLVTQRPQIASCKPQRTAQFSLQTYHAHIGRYDLTDYTRNKCNIGPGNSSSRKEILVIRRPLETCNLGQEFHLLVQSPAFVVVITICALKLQICHTSAIFVSFM